MQGACESSIGEKTFREGSNKYTCHQQGETCEEATGPMHWAFGSMKSGETRMLGHDRGPRGELITTSFFKEESTEYALGLAMETQRIATCHRLDFKTLEEFQPIMLWKSPRTMPRMRGGAINDVCALEEVRVGFCVQVRTEETPKIMRSDWSRAAFLDPRSFFYPSVKVWGGLLKWQFKKHDEVVLMWHRFSCRCSTVPTREDTPLSLEKPIFELGSDRELLEMRFMERCFGPQVCRMKTPLMPTHPWCGFVHCKNFKIVWSYWSRVFFFFSNLWIQGSLHCGLGSRYAKMKQH